MSVLYPRRCPVCFGIVTPKGELVCAGCRNKLRYLKEPLCKCCGTPLAGAEQEYCCNCRRQPKSFRAAISLFSYASVSGAMSALKYKDKREYADFFAWELARRYGRTIVNWEPQALVPVPLHWFRRLGRGYNQAELIAGKLGKLLEIPLRTDLLRRTHYTSPQRILGSEERGRNLENAFSAGTISLRTVVLIDDIYTTGSTAEACTKALHRAGVQNVYVVTAACGQNGQD